MKTTTNDHGNTRPLHRYCERQLKDNFKFQKKPKSKGDGKSKDDGKSKSKLNPEMAKSLSTAKKEFLAKIFREEVQLLTKIVDGIRGFRRRSVRSARSRPQASMLNSC